MHDSAKQDDVLSATVPRLPIGIALLRQSNIMGEITHSATRADSVLRLAATCT